MFEKLNEFAKGTYEMGESLLRKITLPDFFSRSSSDDSADNANVQGKKEGTVGEQDNDDESSGEDSGSPRDSKQRAAAAQAEL